MRPTLSIIFVYYNTPGEIVKSVQSIPRAADNIYYEIIIVDNASSKQISSIIIRNKNVKIIKNDQNYGYGKALNQGVKRASGKYILLVNSDTQFNKYAIKDMVDRLRKDNKIGVLGPLIVNEKGKMLQSISSMPLLPRALVIFSFLRKIWPTNIFHKIYHNENLDRTREQVVDVVGGVCILIKKSVFEKVDGFDERFFMYFEEADFCYRIKKLGYKIVFYPKAKIIHFEGRSIQDKKKIQKIFEQSRLHFFIKYHGLIFGVLGELTLRAISLRFLFLFGILALSLFLNIYRLSELMIFIGDQGWFYLSARDIITTGNIPLVGITTSHTWLHQGPLWTYALAPILWLFRFNPISGAYFTAILGTISVWILYRLCKNLFSEKVGFISALLYSTSPLVIMNSRFAYHTSPIPLFTIFFLYSCYQWMKGKVYYFPLIIFELAILYNLELATVSLWILFLIILSYGVWKKTELIYKLKQKKIILLSILGFLLPMFTIIIYDTIHRFAQTIKFVSWIAYRLVLFPLSATDSTFFFGKLMEVNNFLMENLRILIVFPSNMIAGVISIGAFVWISKEILMNYKKKKESIAYLLVVLLVIFPLAGIFITLTPSSAYLPILFPGYILLLSLFINKFLNMSNFKLASYVAIAIIVALNLLYLFKNVYIDKEDMRYNGSYVKRLEITKRIIQDAKDDSYNLIGKGPGSQFESFTMNYEYLAWWLGKPPSKKKESLSFLIHEEDGKLWYVRKNVNK